LSPEAASPSACAVAQLSRTLIDATPHAKIVGLFDMTSSCTYGKRSPS
jgi:hypothetical protein